LRVRPSSFILSQDSSFSNFNTDEFPGHIESVDLNYRAPYPPPHSFSPPEPELGSSPLSLPSHDPIIEKSNLLLLGPSGVGKTYIIKTLASVLEVPFATVDCSSLTQAGYIGTDIESSIERLLSASNNNIEKCESGIIFFDEVDKLAKPAIMTHGRDVSGEGVQQGLLKMIEGTTITVNSKSDRNAKSESQSRGSDRLDRGGREGLGTAGQGSKSEQYTIDTSNILFIFAGAFIGLERIISSRLSSGSSIGFGASLKALPPTSTPSSTPSTPLDSVTAQDLQTYGLIPELLGRIPILTSLSPLSLTQLVSILTEPQNSLVKQFTSLLGTSGIQLKFSTGAIHAIAERALDGSSHSQGSGKDKGKSSGGIGARGLRSIMEEVLHEIMYHGPGSGIRYCLVDEKFVRGSTTETSQLSSHSHSQSREHGGEEKSLMPLCWSRGQGRLFEEAWEKEEESWRRKEEEKGRKERGEEEQPPATFERLRSVGRSGM
jgi:ATP-dependent Clp protease ATP-binding subunit ClpX